MRQARTVRVSCAPLPRGNTAATARERLAGAKPVGDLSDEPALEPGCVELVLRRLTLALAAGDRRRAVRRAADDLVERHLALIRIGQPDDHQAEMEEIGDAGEQRRLLAAVLRRGRRHDAADLAVERAARPEAARLVEKVRHLRAHATVAR